jgi:hypothetical protein
MVALMLRLVLRAGEVASLLLEDIDWRSGCCARAARETASNGCPCQIAHALADAGITGPGATNWHTAGCKLRESEDQPSRSCSVTNPRPQRVPTSRPTSNSGSGHLTAPHRPAPAWARGRARGHRTLRRAARSRPPRARRRGRPCD